MEARNGFWNKNEMIYHFITLVIDPKDFRFPLENPSGEGG
jgi:hypothetical protein